MVPIFKLLEVKVTEPVKEQKKEKRKGASGLFIPAGLFLGMGIGWVFDYLVQGMFIGLGVGFLIFAVVLLTMRE
jgi:hypothetical protein